MNDQIGRTLERGQIVAIGKRQGNYGALDLGIVDYIRDGRVSVLYATARYSFQEAPSNPRRGGCTDSRRILIVDDLPRNEETESLLHLRDGIKGDNN